MTRFRPGWREAQNRRVKIKKRGSIASFGNGIFAQGFEPAGLTDDCERNGLPTQGQPEKPRGQGLIERLKSKDKLTDDDTVIIAWTAAQAMRNRHVNPQGECSDEETLNSIMTVLDDTRVVVEAAFNKIRQNRGWRQRSWPFTRARLGRGRTHRHA